MITWLYAQHTSNDILFSANGDEVMSNCGNQRFAYTVDFIIQSYGHVENASALKSRILCALEQWPVKRCLQYDSSAGRWYPCNKASVDHWVSTVVKSRLHAVKTSRADGAKKTQKEDSTGKATQCRAFPLRIRQHNQMASADTDDNNRGMKKAKLHLNSLSSPDDVSTPQPAQPSPHRQCHMNAPSVTAAQTKPKGPAADKENYIEPTDHDMIFTDSNRSKMISRLDNQRFSRLAATYLKEYQDTAANHKSRMCSRIFHRLQQSDPPMRFLQTESVSGRYCLCPEEFAIRWIQSFLETLARRADPQNSPKESTAVNSNNSLNHHKATPNQTDQPFIGGGNMVTSQPLLRPSKVGGGAPISTIREETCIGAGRPNGNSILPIEIDDDDDDDHSHEGNSNNNNQNNIHQGLGLDQYQDQSNYIAHEHTVYIEEEEYDEEKEYQYMEQLNRAMELGFQEDCPTDEEYD
ncbi:unnamed protein product [Cylindrotheca closterium]|uniref:Uncharacterized protein n=1 Tax=Cylindrotheca closterium TaxID=2856 RepID=A0AAD2FLB1_9STRA|nr:unnamed protein product [Cylindrotheca closterium]